MGHKNDDQKNKYTAWLMSFFSRFTPRLIFGYLLAIGTVITTAISVVAVQLLQGAVPDYQLSAYRFIMQFLVSIPVIYFRGIPIELKVEQVPLIIVMCIACLFYNICYFAAVSILPLAHVQAGFSVASMLLTSILTKFWLDKDLGYIHGFSLLFASFGVTLINQPWSTFSSGFLPSYMRTYDNSSLDLTLCENQTLINDSLIHQFQKNTDASESIDSFPIKFTVAIGYILVTLAGFSQATHYLVVGIYLNKLNPFFQALIGAIVNVPASFLISMYVEEMVLITNARDILLLIIHCLGTSVGLIISNGSAQRIPPTHLALIQSFSVVTFLGIQYSLIGSGLTGHKNALEVIGVLIITASIVFSTLTSVPKKQHEDF